MRNIVLLAFLSLMISLPALGETFVFTAIPDADETRLSARFAKVAEYLEEKLEVEVRYLPVKSYPAAVTAFRNDQVQLAWFGGLTGVQARRLSSGAEAIAQGEEDQLFKSYFIAHHSTGLSAAEKISPDVNGMSFTFGSKSSTSGRLMPEFYLQQQFDKSPDELFSRVGFSGNHSRTIALVQSGTYQLGALNYQVWDQQLAEGNIDLSKVSVIWTTPNYTDYQWTVRGDVNERWGAGFKEKITKALLEMKDPELLNRFPRSGFIPANNSDYQAIEKTARDIGLLD